MSNQPSIPDPEKVKQTIARSRRTCQEMELVGLELEEVIAKLEHHNRQQQMKRLRTVLNTDSTEKQLFNSNSTEILS